ncbi:MAG: peptidoglycan DD-metalloendopeptidase family protein, partial [Armatimonadota bacterium]|nr:peptidoglycan DD-metalloendopeptidase family protein [Armatimonadota bacterium]
LLPLQNAGGVDTARGHVQDVQPAPPLNAPHGLQVFPAPPASPMDLPNEKDYPDRTKRPIPKPLPALPSWDNSPQSTPNVPDAGSGDAARPQTAVNPNSPQADAVRAKMRALVKTGLALTEQIHQDEMAAADATSRLATGQVRLQQLDGTLGVTLQNLTLTRSRLVADRSTLKMRLRDVYEHGNVGIVELLLNSKNLTDFMNRREYARRVVDRDLAVVGQVHADENDLAVESQSLRLAQTQKSQEVQLIQGETQRLNGAIADRANILVSAEQEMDSAAKSVSEMESESSSIEGMLHRLQSLPALSVRGMTGQLLYHLHWGGQLIMPVVGTVTSPFGYRYHPILHIYRLHTGVDLGAPIGTPVHAAAPGVVIHAGWLGGYGNAIIIDHGDGLATLYGHLSQIDVAVGQALAQAQEIGLVGTTGLSTGPHLHFEVRKYGTPVPPF